jgi:antitoxin HicB
MNLEYPFKIESNGEGGFIVQFVDFEEIFTEGATVEECMGNAREALSGVLEQRMADGEEIPLPSKGRYKYRVVPDARVQAALLVKFSRAGQSKAEFARTMGAKWPVVQRLENPKHSPTLKQLERAAAAMGKRLVLTFE